MARWDMPSITTTFSLRSDILPLLLHPLCGGTPPELAWETLRLVGERILPALK